MRTRHARRALVATIAALSAFALSAPARADAGRPDTVTEWNSVAATLLTGAAPDGAAQGAPAIAHLAMVHGAVYDAVNAIDGRHRPYLVAPPARRWYSQDAAAATAAYRASSTANRPCSRPRRLRRWPT